MMMNLVRVPVATGLLTLGALVSAATIDRMNTATFGHYTQDYQPGGTFMVFSQADTYLLSDGTSWNSGAGSHPAAYSTPASVAVSGSEVTYAFDAPPSGLLFSNTDYNFGDHSAQGELGLPAALAITAQIGGSTGVMSGYTKIVSNDETWYGQPRFNYYSAPVGSFVYFEQTFSLPSDTFTSDLFSRSFVYNESGYVDFTRLQPIPEPATATLNVLGLLGIAMAIHRRRHTRSAARSERTTARRLLQR